MNLVKISIISPSFNSVNYIKTCIQNVIDQKNEFIEHVIVDGGSKDGTVDIIKEYAVLYPHIRWISEKDGGQSDAMNKGINLAKGEYISFLNVDDTYEKNVVSDVLEIIQKKKYNFIVGNCNVWNEKGEFIYTSKPKESSFYPFYFKQSFPINPSSYFYKKKLHNILGGYNSDNHLVMDLEFILKYMNKFKRYYYVDRVWGNFNMVISSKTYNDSELGKTQERKKKLFDYYWKKNNRFLRFYFILINLIFKRY